MSERLQRGRLYGRLGPCLALAGAWRPGLEGERGGVNRVGVALAALTAPPDAWLVRAPEVRAPLLGKPLLQFPL